MRTFSLSFIILSFALTTPASAVWVENNSTPPDLNASAPIHVGSEEQNKVGSIVLGTEFTLEDTANPGEFFASLIKAISGSFGILQITSGAGAGKVLTSDEFGNATWQNPTGGATLSGGTAGSIPKWTGATTIGNSILSETTGANPRINIAGSLLATGNLNTDGNIITLTGNVSGVNVYGTKGIFDTVTLSNGAGAGKVLTSDPSGNATWQTPTGGGSGTITGVIAGTGLSGGGNTGSVTLSANTSVLQSRVSGTCPTGQYMRAINSNGSVTCGTDAGSSGVSGSGTGAKIPLWTGTAGVTGITSVTNSIIDQKAGPTIDIAGALESDSTQVNGSFVALGSVVLKTSVAPQANQVLTAKDSSGIVEWKNQTVGAGCNWKTKRGSPGIGATFSVSCSGTERAISGGGSCANGRVSFSSPYTALGLIQGTSGQTITTSVDIVNGWAIQCEANGNDAHAYVLCCPK